MDFTPVLKRVALGKLLGLIIGGVAAWCLASWTSVPATLVWGISLWFLTLGAIVGIIGFYNRIPLIGLPLPAWLRGGWCGLWMGLVMVLLSYGELQLAISEITWLPDYFRSPWWALLDAAIAGAAIDIIATRVIGVVDWRGSGVSSRG